MDTIDQLERRANTQSIIAALTCIGAAAVFAALIINRINLSRELSFLPVLLPVAFSVPAIVLHIVHSRIRARLNASIAQFSTAQFDRLKIPASRQTTVVPNRRGGIQPARPVETNIPPTPFDEID